VGMEYRITYNIPGDHHREADEFSCELRGHAEAVSASRRWAVPVTEITARVEQRSPHTGWEPLR
jgi:hypothetical protein